MKRSLDLREQALIALAGGMKRSQVCQVFGIHRTTLRRWQVRQEQVLLPTLVPEQIVVLDNLIPHKSLTAQKMVEQAGCRWLFLPPYSLDFNPIKMLWSKFKSDLRREALRPQEHLDSLLWPLLSPATPSHAHNSFNHAIYYLMQPL